MLVGAGIVATRHVVAEVPPLTLALLRYAIGVVCLLPFGVASWRAARMTATLRDLAAMAALGIGQFAVLIAFMNWGLQHIGAAQGALIFSLFPLLTLMLGAALGREEMTARLLAGVLVSIAGVALSLAPKIAASGGSAHAGGWWGELAIFAAALVGAICSVLYRPYLRRYPTMPVSTYAMAASVVFLVVAAAGEQWPSRIAAIAAPAWAAIVFIGVASAVGYYLWLYALKHESPTRVTVFLALNPVTAAVLGAVLLGERLHPALLVALALIAAGLWLSARGSPGKRQPRTG